MHDSFLDLLLVVDEMVLAEALKGTLLDQCLTGSMAYAESVKSLLEVA